MIVTAIHENSLNGSMPIRWITGSGRFRDLNRDSGLTARAGPVQLRVSSTRSDGVSMGTPVLRLNSASRCGEYTRVTESSSNDCDQPRARRSTAGVRPQTFFTIDY
jgi:hypothetical protein